MEALGGVCVYVCVFSVVVYVEEEMIKSEGTITFAIFFYSPLLRFHPFLFSFLRPVSQLSCSVLNKLW